MSGDFNLKVKFNGKDMEAHLWNNAGGRGSDGVEIIWYLSININSETREVMRMSEYPQRHFSEIKRDPLLTEPLRTFTNIIIADRGTRED